jgi:hypothetical protein
MTAIELLTEDLFGIYTAAGREVTYTTGRGEVRPYWANRYRQAVQRAVAAGDVVDFVERLVLQEEPSRGFGYLAQAGRLDLAVEALVVDEHKSYHRVFSANATAASRRRLADYGFRITSGGFNETLSARTARHGEKMITLKIQFFTNRLAGSDSMILPKHAWSEGVVRMDKNETHGIESTQTRFNLIRHWT